MRVFGAPLGICAPLTRLFSLAFLLFEMMILKGKQQWLMNHSSAPCRSHWNAVIRHLSSKSFPIRPLIPVTLVSAAFLLCHINLFFPPHPSFLPYTPPLRLSHSLWQYFLSSIHSLFCFESLLCSLFLRFHSRSSLIFTLCKFAISFSPLSRFSDFHFYNFPFLLLFQFRSKKVIALQIERPVTKQSLWQCKNFHKNV